MLTRSTGGTASSVQTLKEMAANVVDDDLVTLTYFYGYTPVLSVWNDRCARHSAPSGCPFRSQWSSEFTKLSAFVSLCGLPDDTGRLCMKAYSRGGVVKVSDAGKRLRRWQTLRVWDGLLRQAPARNHFLSSPSCSVLSALSAI